MIIILTIVALYATLFILYDLLLAAVHVLTRAQAAPVPPARKRFAVVIPAHNEQLLLARLLKSLRDQIYAPGLFTVIVVADNCTDGTALLAREHGAIVLERNDPADAGKGQAIRFALEHTDLTRFDAVLIIDADSIAAPDVLLRLNELLLRGRAVIQCYNGVANPDESWFTRLLDVSRTMGNEIYHPAKQRLGLSSYLMGNGMCFSSATLLKYGWDAFTVGEDWEYYAKLIGQGEVIAFAEKARVYHQESQSLRQATSQRMRWSSGRFAVAGRYGMRLFSQGVREADIRKIDASLPLLFPNPSLGMNITLLGCLFSLAPLGSGESALFFWFLFLVLAQVLLFTFGVMHTRNRMRKFLSLFIAPAFLVWKLVIDAASLAGIGRKKWVRTERRL